MAVQLPLKSLSTFARNPCPPSPEARTLVEGVVLDQVPRLLAEVGGLMGRLGGLSLALAGKLATTRAPEPASGDTLFTAREAAERLGVTTDFLYRTKALPFRVQVSPGRVRFSKAGMERWLRLRRNGT
jgi:predicted DNA-binding transcriptional regulator AlpA